jgi:hypothetical protein
MRLHTLSVVIPAMPKFHIGVDPVKLFPPNFKMKLPLSAHV